MTLKSPYRRSRLAPRCRSSHPGAGEGSKGLDCSSIKVVRDLGLERRETVWSLSTVDE